MVMRIIEACVAGCKIILIGGTGITMSSTRIKIVAMISNHCRGVVYPLPRQLLGWTNLIEGMIDGIRLVAVAIPGGETPHPCRSYAIAEKDVIGEQI